MASFLASAIMPGPASPASGTAKPARTVSPARASAHAHAHDYNGCCSPGAVDTPPSMLPSHLMPLPPITHFFDSSSVMDTRPWWDAGLFLDVAPVSSAQLCAEFVDEFAHLRPRVSTSSGMPTPQAAFITPPQQQGELDMPTELLEAAAVALLASSRGSSRSGPASAPAAIAAAGLSTPVEPTPVRHASLSGVVRHRHAARRPTLGPSPRLHALLTHALDAPYQYDDVPTVYCCRWLGCTAVFAAPQELTDHVGQEHIPRRQDVYYCGWAECKRASHVFRHRDKLMVHVRLHTGDRRFRCAVDGCGREFSRADSFEEHRRVHASEGRAQICDIAGCGRRYYHAKSLRKHQRMVHGMLFAADLANPAQAVLAAAALETMAQQPMQSLPPPELVSPLLLQRPFMF